jgi:hypothetical protein
MNYLVIFDLLEREVSSKLVSTWHKRNSPLQDLNTVVRISLHYEVHIDTCLKQNLFKINFDSNCNGVGISENASSTTLLVQSYM